MYRVVTIWTLIFLVIMSWFMTLNHFYSQPSQALNQMNRFEELQQYKIDRLTARSKFINILTQSLKFVIEHNGKSIPQDISFHDLCGYFLTKCYDGDESGMTLKKTVKDDLEKINNFKDKKQVSQAILEVIRTISKHMDPEMYIEDPNNSKIIAMKLANIDDYRTIYDILEWIWHIAIFSLQIEKPLTVPINTHYIFWIDICRFFKYKQPTPAKSIVYAPQLPGRGARYRLGCFKGITSNSR